MIFDVVRKQLLAIWQNCEGSVKLLYHAGYDFLVVSYVLYDNNVTPANLFFDDVDHADM